jgi:hypothetical protein
MERAFPANAPGSSCHAGGGVLLLCAGVEGYVVAAEDDDYFDPALFAACITVFCMRFSPAQYRLISWPSGSFR